MLWKRRCRKVRRFCDECGSEARSIFNRVSAPNDMTITNVLSVFGLAVIG